LRGFVWGAILGTESIRMATQVNAVFEHGAFVPETPVDLPEGMPVVLSVSPRPGVEPPKITDPEERKRILRSVVESMLNEPLPEGAPTRFTRDELHERR
jgi:predicted DNA-binding antitoxin AbrB/MazE fold protein